MKPAPPVTRTCISMEANRAGDGGTAGERGPNAASYPKVVGDVYTAAS